MVREHHDVVAPGSVPREPLKRSEDPIQAVKRSQGLGPELTGMVGAVVEEMDAGGRCHASDVLGEGCGRPIDQVGALGEADRPPGSPVHGDGMIWLQDQEDKADQDHRQGRGRTQSVTLQRNTGQAEVSCSHRDFERATTPRRQRESQLHPGLLSLPPPHSTMTVVVTAATDRDTSTNPSASRVTIPATWTATVTELDATRSHQDGDPWLRIE